uniref:Uncharacterized protein n=1 Tax=Triticum urartu TaxID=4572 RepID=A0A8R7QYL5_TRIUA
MVFHTFNPTAAGLLSGPETLKPLTYASKAPSHPCHADFTVAQLTPPQGKLSMKKISSGFLPHTRDPLSPSFLSSPPTPSSFPAAPPRRLFLRQIHRVPPPVLVPFSSPVPSSTSSSFISPISGAIWISGAHGREARCLLLGEGR